MRDDQQGRPGDTVRAAWEAYRGECFIRPGPAPAWVWAAAHDFDFHLAALHLLDEPSARVDVGTVAIALTVFGEHHIVPIVRLTPLSMEHLQPQTEFPLAERHIQLREAQRRAESSLDEDVCRRYRAILPSVSVDGEQTH